MMKRMTALVACSGLIISVIGSCKATSGAKSRGKDILYSKDSGLSQSTPARFFGVARENGQYVCFLKCASGFQENGQPKNKSDCEGGSLKRSDFLEKLEKIPTDNSKDREAVKNLTEPNSKLLDLTKDKRFNDYLDKIANLFLLSTPTNTVDTGLGQTETQVSDDFKKCVATSAASTGISTRIAEENSGASSDPSLKGWRFEQTITGPNIVREIRLNGGELCRHKGKSMFVRVFAVDYDQGEGQPFKNVPSNLKEFIRQYYAENPSPSCDESLVRANNCNLTMVIDDTRIPIKAFDMPHFGSSGKGREMSGGLATRAPDPNRVGDIGSGYSFRLVVSSSSCKANRPFGAPVNPESAINAPCISITTPDNQISVCNFEEIPGAPSYEPTRE